MDATFCSFYTLTRVVTYYRTMTAYEFVLARLCAMIATIPGNGAFERVVSLLSISMLVLINISVGGDRMVISF